MSKLPLSRRAFLAAAATFTIVPRRVLGGPNETPPSEQLRVAGIGAAGQAMADLGQVSMGADIVALCDVDSERAAPAHQRWPAARGYGDWREMLDKEKDQIDAVVIAIPDHNHAAAAAAAMQLGKHVYVEKPMAHNIAEVRKLMQLAKDTGVVTQMGNQGHSFPGVHRFRAWMDQGAIGDVREVHCWTNRPGWKQGIDRPADTPPVPPTLNWDLWLGAAPERPYHPFYCPRSWRGWWDFGTCALGDMGCHILDAAHHGLRLGPPTRISAEAEGATKETGPIKSKIVYEFPDRGPGFPACTLTWYDGGNMFPRPEELEADKPLGDNDGGTLFIGETGKVICGTYSNGMRMIPKAAEEAYEAAHGKAEMYRGKGHHQNWINACKGEGAAVSNFDYAGPLTELVHLGNIAIRAGQPIEWDAAGMKITNLPEANAFLQREYRPGWA